MKYIKSILTLVISFGLLCMASVTACAREVPDMAKTGSVCVSMTYDGKPVPGGTLTLYQAGEICGDDGNYSFILTGDFLNCGQSLEDISSSVLAAGLAGYAAENDLTGQAVPIGADGKMTVTGLIPGLYLVVQTEAAEGFEAVSPFLVSLPMNDDGTYIYDVDAAPKVSTLIKTPDTSTPTPPAETPAVPTEPSAPAVPADPKLPQTGQLNWPIPVLAMLGLLLFSIGWALRFGKRETPYEA